MTSTILYKEFDADNQYNMLIETTYSKLILFSPTRCVVSCPDLTTIQTA